MISDYVFLIVMSCLCLGMAILVLIDIIVVQKINKNVKKVFEQYKMLEDLGIIEKYGLNEEQVNEIYKGNNHE